MATAQILQKYDPNLPFIEEVDASKVGVGDEFHFVDYTDLLAEYHKTSKWLTPS